MLTPQIPSRLKHRIVLVAGAILLTEVIGYFLVPRISPFFTLLIMAALGAGLFDAIRPHW